MQLIFPQTALRIDEWRQQAEVLGVLLVGSKSRGYDDARSDDDLEVLLTDEAHARLTPSQCIEYYTEGEGEARRLIYDVQFTTLTDLVQKADSSRDLDHWPYERSPVLFGRDERVGAAVAAAGRMAAEFRRARLRHALIDTWIAGGRADKTFGRGMERAGRLIVARGAKALARLIFALEWRWVALDHWLEPELKSLEADAGAGSDLLEALATGRHEPVGRALERLEDRLAAEGLPRSAAERGALFYELIHPTHAAERAIHGLN